MPYTQEQINNAQTIMSVAMSEGLGTPGQILGVMTALTESGLVIVMHGDSSNSTSLGLFQQIQTWGTIAARTDATQSAQLFFEAVKSTPGYQLYLMSGNFPGLAQAVQQSEFGDGSNYLAELGNAKTLVSQLNSGGLSAAPVNGTTSGGNSNGAIAVAAIITKVGGPYQWGGTGPTAFDCSGLTQWAWKQAGVDIPRQSFQQGGLPSVTRDQLQPGDLITYYNPISHVAMYIGGGNVVSAADNALGIIQAPIAYAGANVTTTYHRPAEAVNSAVVTVNGIAPTGTTKDGLYTWTARNVPDTPAYTLIVMSPTATNPRKEDVLINRPVNATDGSQDSISYSISTKDPKTGLISNSAGYSAVTITTPAWTMIMADAFGIGPLLIEWNRYQTQFYDTPTDRGGGGGKTPGESIVAGITNWADGVLGGIGVELKMVGIIALGAALVGFGLYLVAKNNGLAPAPTTILKAVAK